MSTVYPTSLKRKPPYITVSAKGIVNGLSSIPNDGADFGPDTLLNATAPHQYGPPYTQTAGIQEAINYAASVGSGKIFIKSGNYNITSTSQAPIVIPFDTPLEIEGEDRYSTILNSKGGFFFFQNPGTGNINTHGVTIKKLTMYATLGYWFKYDARYIQNGTAYYNPIQNITLKNLSLYGGGNLGTGAFNIGASAAPSTTPTSPYMYNILLKDIYIDTQGTSGGNEAVTFPLTYTRNLVLDNVYVAPASNLPTAAIGFFDVYGGDIVVKNAVNDTGYFYNMAVTTTTTPASLWFDNMYFRSPLTTGGQSGFLPVDLIFTNINAQGLFWSAGANVFVRSITAINILRGIDAGGGLLSGINAYNIIAKNIVYTFGWNAPYELQTQFALPALPTGVPANSGSNVICNYDIDLDINIPSNQANVFPLFSFPTSPGYSVQIRLRGQIPFSVTSQLVIIGSNTYGGLNAFQQAYSAYPSIFNLIDVDAIDTTTGTRVKQFFTSIAPSTPAMPASGTAQQNTNSYPVEVALYGGTVTEITITRNGTTYTVFSNSAGAALSGQTYRLNPGDSITLTYSSAPTWVWLPA